MYDNIIPNEDLQLAALKKLTKTEDFIKRFVAYLKSAICCSNLYLSDKKIKNTDDFGYINGVWNGLLYINFSENTDKKCEYTFFVSINATSSSNFEFVMSSKKQEKLVLCFDYRNITLANENFDKILKYIGKEISMKMDF